MRLLGRDQPKVAVLAAALLFVFDAGQASSEKRRLVDAADAAALSAATWQARALNFESYMNRAVIANEAAIAQSVSLRSWSAYMNRMLPGAAALTRVVPLLNAATLALERVWAAFDAALQPGLATFEGMLSLVDHDQPPYHDKDGHPRDSARLQWWNSDARTLRELAEMGGNFTTGSGEPYPTLPELEVARGETDFVYRNKVPVFYGHYWRQGLPKYLHDWTDYTACVDFSAVKDGALTAYRWSGERWIDPENYVSVAATGTYQLLRE